MRTLWAFVGALGAVVVIGALGRVAWAHRPQAGFESLPSTPLQRLATVGLALDLVVAAGLAVIVAIGGASGFDESPLARRAFAALVLVAVLLWTVTWRRTMRRSGGAAMDERDRAILASSAHFGTTMVLAALVVWTIALTEAFGSEGNLPIAYLQLVFWTSFLAGVFGESLGIVLGYRRETTFDA